jgi:hypothetical protein
LIDEQHSVALRTKLMKQAGPADASTNDHDIEEVLFRAVPLRLTGINQAYTLLFSGR